MLAPKFKALKRLQNTVNTIEKSQKVGSGGWKKPYVSIYVFRQGSNHLRMVMEPKYNAFRRLLDIPCSSFENMTGSLGLIYVYSLEVQDQTKNGL